MSEGPYLFAGIGLLMLGIPFAEWLAERFPRRVKP